MILSVNSRSVLRTKIHISQLLSEGNLAKPTLVTREISLSVLVTFIVNEKSNQGGLPKPIILLGTKIFLCILL